MAVPLEQFLACSKRIFPVNPGDNPPNPENKWKIVETRAAHLDTFSLTSAFESSSYHLIYPQGIAQTGTPDVRGEKVVLRAGIVIWMDWKARRVIITYGNKPGDKFANQPFTWEGAELWPPRNLQKPLFRMMWIKGPSQGQVLRQVINENQASAIEYAEHPEGRLESYLDGNGLPLDNHDVPFHFIHDSFTHPGFREPRKDTLFFNPNTGGLTTYVFEEASRSEGQEPVYSCNVLPAFLSKDGSIRVGVSTVVPFIDLNALLRPKAN